jgi:hypothetical protein
MKNNMPTFLGDCAQYQNIQNNILNRQLDMLALQTYLPMINNKTMKRETRQELNTLVITIKRIDRDVRDLKRNFNSIKTSVDKQNDIINLILEHLKVEVIEEDYIKEEANVSPAFVDYCSIIGGNCNTKKSIETRLKLKKVNKK